MHILLQEEIRVFILYVSMKEPEVLGSDKHSTKEVNEKQSDAARGATLLQYDKRFRKQIKFASLIRKVNDSKLQ